MAAGLLIDDDEGILRGVEHAAQTRGLDLVAASTWDEGLALFHVLGPNLVIADYNMPGSRHGLQLLARVGRLRPSVRLILVSGYLAEDDLARVEALGLVHRAIAKDGSGAALIEEVANAAARADQLVDWRAYASAYLAREAVPEGELGELDTLLRSKVEGGSAGEGR